MGIDGFSLLSSQIEIAQGLEVQHHFDIVAEQQSNGDAVIVLGDGPVAVANDAMQALQAGALVGVRDLPAVDGDDSPGADRQPSQSSSGSGMVSGISDVSSFGLTTTPLCRTPSSSGQS